MQPIYIIYSKNIPQKEKNILIDQSIIKPEISRILNQCSPLGLKISLYAFNKRIGQQKVKIKNHVKPFTKINII
jgi:hypothetical protein